MSHTIRLKFHSSSDGKRQFISYLHSTLKSKKASMSLMLFAISCQEKLDFIVDLKVDNENIAEVCNDIDVYILKFKRKCPIYSEVTYSVKPIANRPVNAFQINIGDTLDRSIIETLNGSEIDNDSIFNCAFYHYVAGVSRLSTERLLLLKSYICKIRPFFPVTFDFNQFLLSNNDALDEMYEDINVMCEDKNHPLSIWSQNVGQTLQHAADLPNEFKRIVYLINSRLNIDELQNEIINKLLEYSILKFAGNEIKI